MYCLHVILSDGIVLFHVAVEVVYLVSFFLFLNTSELMGPIVSRGREFHRLIVYCVKRHYLKFAAFRFHWLPPDFTGCPFAPCWEQGEHFLFYPMYYSFASFYTQLPQMRTIVVQSQCVRPLPSCRLDGPCPLKVIRRSLTDLS